MIPIKKILSLFLCALAISSLCACGSKEQSMTIYTNTEEILLTTGSVEEIAKHENKAYLQLVVDEAIEIIAGIKQLDKIKATKELYRGGYKVYTAFDSEVSSKLTASCNENAKEMDTVAVITDLKGRVCAVYSTQNNNINFVTAKSPPCSAIKPLSVYAPAIDNNTINWFTRYEDSPYSYIINENGEERPWPYNNTNSYNESLTYINQAVYESINTIAVKCLDDYGVRNSIAFLEKNFGINLDVEKTIIANKDENEIIGNLALGSLVTGVSPLDMVGYYQIFANGGLYQAPQTITKICDSDGNEIYTAEYKPKIVIKRSTSALMNYMLQDVVSPRGTGKNAMCKGIKIAGKTGTDDDYKNNWFVGVTPDYCFAFWHGRNSKNITTELFADAITSIYEDKTEKKENFAHLASVKEIAFCTESGKMFTSSCPTIEKGYFVPDQPLLPCDEH